MKRFYYFTLSLARSRVFWLASVFGSIGVVLLCEGFSVSTHIPIAEGSVKTIYAGIVVTLFSLILGVVSILRTIDYEPGVASKTHQAEIPEELAKKHDGRKLAAAAEMRKAKQ